MRAGWVPGGCAIALVSVALSACSSRIGPSPAGDVDTGTSDEGGDAVGAACAFDPTGRVPKQHRAIAEACPSDRPPDARPPITDPTAPRDDQCASDAECWLLPNGRCVPVINHNQCTFDVCFDDGDCPRSEVCACRVALQLVRHEPIPPVNMCVGGNCRVDADCGTGGWCSPSRRLGSCGGESLDGWFCHTPRDCCYDDDECSGSTCAFDRVAGSWACAEVGGCTG